MVTYTIKTEVEAEVDIWEAFFVDLPRKDMEQVFTDLSEYVSLECIKEIARRRGVLE